MNDRFGFRTLLSVSKNMRHDIMTDFFFPLGCNIQVQIRLMDFQLVDLLLSYRQTQFHFRFRKGDPQPSPGGEFLFVGEVLSHFPGSITGN
jgi:hypothetical protein